MWHEQANADRVARAPVHPGQAQHATIAAPHSAAGPRQPLKASSRCSRRSLGRWIAPYGSHPHFPLFA